MLLSVSCNIYFPILIICVLINTCEFLSHAIPWTPEMHIYIDLRFVREHDKSIHCRSLLRSAEHRTLDMEIGKC